MAFCRITVVSKPDGTFRYVSQTSYGTGTFDKVVLSSGEKAIFLCQGNTLISQILDGKEDPLPEELKVEILAFLESFLCGDIDYGTPEEQEEFRRKILL